MAKIDIAEFNRQGRANNENTKIQMGNLFDQLPLSVQKFEEEWGGEAFAKANLVVINNPKCFSTEVLVRAQMTYDQLIKANDRFEAYVAGVNAAAGL